jgi:hypothetical protein
MVGFFALALVLAKLWPDYAIHGRQWTRQGVFTFTPMMACCNLVFWVLAEVGAGWVAGKVAKPCGCWQGCWGSISPASHGGTTSGSSFRLFPQCS